MPHLRRHRLGVVDGGFQKGRRATALGRQEPVAAPSPMTGCAREAVTGHSIPLPQPRPRS
jgi:hypothetical protein